MKQTTESKTTVKALKDRAIKSPPFNALCHVFALRERTRQQITVQSLTVKMEKEGFKFTAIQYAKELEFLASLGIGTLVIKNGSVKTLKNIPVTLQSIGHVAIGKDNSLEQNYIQKAANRETKPIRRTRKAVVTQKAPVAPQASGVNKATLLVTINGKKMAMDLDPKLSSDELLGLIFRGAAAVSEV